MQNDNTHENGTGRPALKAQQDAGKFIIAAVIHDMVSALVADRLGFDAIYMTGYGVVASHLGLPDARLATYSDMVCRVGTIADGCKTPLIADGDTGYGGLLNVEHTVRGYERADAAAIQMEDQKFPKNCSLTSGNRCISLEDMVIKIKVASESRDSDEFLIIARTDARFTYGLDDALRRAEAYGKAGADVLFVEGPKSPEEMRIICERLEKPKLVNNVEGSGLPVLPRQELIEIGYDISVHAVAGLLGAIHAYCGVFESLKAEGTTNNCDIPLYPFNEMSKLMGFERVLEFEREHELN
jgi:2-methylisocitrate lyase-like PEP mutase family enzyme